MTCSCSLYTLHPALNSRLGMISSRGTNPHIVQQEILVPLITIIPVQASSILNLSCTKCVSTCPSRTSLGLNMRTQLDPKYV